jgi:RNA polymerase sigma-70 factor (ECF subfamily)
VSGQAEPVEDPGQRAGIALLGLYDEALPQVYGYLVARCGQAQIAQDLTAETFLAAVRAVQSGAPPDPLTAGWLIGVARHKLADHWRREAREQRRLAAVADEAGGDDQLDPWDAQIDALRAHEVLTDLAPQHRAALTLRYVDDLPVAEVAALLGRTTTATEALLVRAKAAFRRAYCAAGGADRDEDRDG